MPEATVEDVLDAVLFSPDGTAYKVVEASIPRTTGSTHDVASVTVIATSRLKELLEFDGSFTPVAPGEFSRTTLPKPEAGSSLSSVGWRLQVTPVDEEQFDVCPLILTEASIVKVSVADSALGPIKPDVGEERPEVWSLSLADIRILWREMGDIAGRRNFRTEIDQLSVPICVPPEELTINAPKVEFNKDEGTIELGEPEEVKLNIPEIGPIGADFDPITLEAGKLSNVKELLEEIADRLPFLKPHPGGQIVGPPEMAFFLSKINVLDIDYGRRMSPSQALELIARKVGLVHGLQLDSRLFFEFDAIPLSTQFQKSGVLGRQLRWSSEDRGALVRPRAPKFRIYPSKVVKEIAITDWKRVAKDTDGKIVPIETLLAKLDLDKDEKHITYLAAVKAETDKPGKKDKVEETAQDVPETAEQQEQAEKQERLRIAMDSVGRSYQYAPPFFRRRVIRDIAESARADVRAQFRARAKADDEFGEGGNPAEEETGTLFGLFDNALMDKLLASPLNVVTKVKGFDLKPRFFGDVLLRRTYDFLGQIGVIVFNSFDDTTFISFGPPFSIQNAGFNQTTYDALIRGIDFFGDRLGTPIANESFARPDATCPRFDDRTLRRTPVDWAEAKHKAETLQSHYYRVLGKDNTETPLFFPTVKIRKQFWESLVANLGIKGVVPALETIVTFVSGEATEFVKKFDSKTGIVNFDVPLGVFRGSKSFRRVLEDGIDFYETEVITKETIALDPNLPSPNAGIIQPPLIDTQQECAIAQKFGIILKDDERSSAAAAKVADEDEVREAQVNFGGVPANDFVAMIKLFRERNPGLPLWQIASLKTMIEKAGDQDGPPQNTLAPTASQDSPQSLAVPSSGSGGSTVVSSQPIDPAGQTEADDIGQEFDEDGLAVNDLPEIEPSPILGRIFVDVPFEEAAWPQMEFGKTSPARVARVNVTWIEDAEGNVINQAEFEEAARQKFLELNSESTVEESEEIPIGGIFKVELGSVVRNVLYAFGEGGRQPSTRISASSLLSRKLPLLRAITAPSKGL